MSPPFTSSDTTCNQHFSLLPLPRRSMLIQCILQHHQICNLEAELVKMNELFDGREDHPLIPSQPRYLTRILYSKPKLYQLIQDTSTIPHETQYIPDSSYVILRNTPFQHQCDDSSQLIGVCGDFFDSIAIESCHRSKSTVSSTHRIR